LRKNGKSVETHFADGNGFGGDFIGLEGLQAGECVVLGLQETQRVAQDRLAVLGAPNRQGGLCLLGRSVSGVAEERVGDRSFERPASWEPILGLSLLRTECLTRGRGMAVYFE
jgi:hypothetical protein